MKGQRAGSKPKFEARHGAAYCAERRLCVECGSALSGRRTRWCSDPCVEEFKIRAWPGYARRAVKQRDRGVCVDCGIDTDAIKKEIKKAIKPIKESWAKERRISFSRRWAMSRRAPSDLRAEIERISLEILTRHGMERYQKRSSWWDMDHIVPVHRGGGDCGLDNLQTLCVLCHAKKTAEGARKRAKKGPKKIARLPSETCEGCRGEPCRPCQGYRERVRAWIGLRYRKGAGP